MAGYCTRRDASKSGAGLSMGESGRPWASVGGKKADAEIEEPTPREADASRNAQRPDAATGSTFPGLGFVATGPPEVGDGVNRVA